MAAGGSTRGWGGLRDDGGRRTGVRGGAGGRAAAHARRAASHRAGERSAPLRGGECGGRGRVRGGN